MFKVNNKDTTCCSVSIVNFEQVNAGWMDMFLFGETQRFSPSTNDLLKVKNEKLRRVSSKLVVEASTSISWSYFGVFVANSEPVLQTAFTIEFCFI